jgi:acyl-CoA synthetase (AMP-forming)/AMP-acid ligase II
MNIIEPILRHGRMQPTAPALVDEDRTISYGALAELVLRTAGHLHALGVRRGDYVGLCLKDDWQHVVALLAIARLGATFVQIDPRTRAVEKARIAAAFDFKLVLTLPEADKIANCATVPLDAAWERRVVQADAPSSLPNEWHDTMVVQSTSGTTGLPKFSVATHLQFYFRLASLCEYMPTTRPHRYLATLPLFSALGRNVCLLHLLHGSTIILYPSIFTATEFVEIATKHHASVAAVAPSSVRQLLAASEIGDPLLPKLELLICGGAPLFADEKREAIRKVTANFHEMYGVSAFGPISVLRPKDIPKWAATSGRPFTLAEVEIVDENERRVDAGETGRLRCRGPALASPITVAGENADNFRDGWHYPGELAALDECGYLHLHGRTSEVVFRGGAKVFPTEIEAVLQAHEKVADAAVVVCGVSSASEQELAAYVIAKGEVTPGQLLAHCRQQLTPYKVPRQIYIVSDLPRNLSGKVDKRALANQSGSPAGAKV